MDDVDVLVVEFAHDVVDAAALDADAGAYGVDAVIVALDGNLCLLARDAGHALQADKSVGDFGYLALQQAAQELVAGAAQVDFRLSVRVVHAVYDGLHRVAVVEKVARYLLVLRKQQFCAVLINQERLALPCLIDFGGHELALALLVLIEEGVVFEFEDFAGERLAKGKDGAATKVGKLDGLADFFAHFVVRVNLTGLAQGDFLVGVGDVAVFHHFAITVDFAVALVRVDDNIEVFVGTVDFRNDRPETFFEHAYQRRAVDVFRFLELCKCLDQADCFAGFLCHGYILLFCFCLLEVNEQTGLPDVVVAVGRLVLV